MDDDLHTIRDPQLRQAIDELSTCAPTDEDDYSSDSDFEFEFPGYEVCICEQGAMYLRSTGAATSDGLDDGLDDDVFDSGTDLGVLGCIMSHHRHLMVLLELREKARSRISGERSRRHLTVNCHGGTL